MASFDSNDRVDIDFDHKSGLLDSLGKLRTTSSKIIFSQHFSDSAHDFNWANRLVGSATQTYDKSKASIYLNTTTTDGDEATRQTRRYFQYTPGQSSLVYYTGKFDTTKTNLVQAMGFFDDNDGLFFRKKSSGMEVVIRDSTSGTVVDTATAQADWNVDKLDGTGDSGITIDFDKGQVFVLDFQWFGYGCIKFGVMVKNRILYCHIINNLNTLEHPYTQRASLPMRFTSYNDGPVTSASILQINSVSVVSEFDNLVGDISRTIDNGTTGKGIDSKDLIPILGLRLQSGFKGAEVTPDSILIYSPDNISIYFQIIANPATITGANWLNESNSIVQKDTSATAVSGGKIIGSGYVLGRGPTTLLDTANSHYRMSIDINNVPDVIYIVARAINGNGDCYGVIDFTEVF